MAGGKSVSLQDSASPMLLNFAGFFVYTVIRARAVLTSLDKTVNAEEFLFLSHGETISS